MLDWNHQQLPIKTQADILSLNRSSLYYKPVQPTAEEVKLHHAIDEMYTRHPVYGSRRITVELQRQGWMINRKRVQRCMREMGIAGICPGPNLSKRHWEHRIFPYLLRHVTPDRPNHVWGIDITYVRLKRGWMYLVAIIDWYSRYIVSWRLDHTLEMPFVLEAVKEALTKATPAILNSDQGSHFTSPKYTEILETAGVQISMDGKGRALDNIITERFWRTLKYEEVYLHEYDTPAKARKQIAKFIWHYNHTRPHQSLGYAIPSDVYHSIVTEESSRIVG